MMSVESHRDPFEYTATGILGDKRGTMLQNQLLLRNELGQSSKRGYSNAPGQAFCYGRPNVVLDGGAAEALGGWSRNVSLSFNRPGGDGGPSAAAGGGGGGKDFMNTNKSAVLSGLTTATEHYNYRAGAGVGGGTGGGAARSSRSQPFMDEAGRTKKRDKLPPNLTYGVATRPSTPVHDLLEHRYQDKWIQERQGLATSRQNTSIKPDVRAERMSAGKVYETRASLLRIHQVPVKDAPLWHMPKFENKGKPSLDTFRTERQKTKSFKNFESDAIARKGVIGHGTYEQAKS